MAFTICVSVNLVFFIIDHLKLVNHSTFKWPNFREAYRKISTINYSSKEEQKAKRALIDKIKKEMYPTVNSWNENVLVAKSEQLLIRLHRTDKGLRYVCWSKGRTIKDAPDIILYDGIEEA